jgi:hypothetical protein
MSWNVGIYWCTSSLDKFVDLRITILILVAIKFILSPCVWVEQLHCLATCSPAWTHLVQVSGMKMMVQ